MTSLPPSARLRTSGLPSRPGTPNSITSPSTPTSSILRSASVAGRLSSSASSVTSLFGGTTLNDAGFSSDADDEPRSLICRAFVPHIAVHVSDDTDALAREKGFSCFQELLRPYGEDLHGRLTVRDSQGISNSYDDFGVRFVTLAEVAAGGEHWETGVSRANGDGRAAQPDGKIPVGGNLEEIEELLNVLLDRREEAAAAARGAKGADEAEVEEENWYYLYLRRLLSALPVAPHETFSHPVACVIAISSRNANPIEALRNLYNEGTRVPVPAYVNPDYLRYYVLVHDEDRDDITKSTALFDQMKKHFGIHCHLLRLRSGGRTVITDDDAKIFPTVSWRSAAEELADITKVDLLDIDEESPKCLPESDITGIRTMVREMTQMSVVPFMERCIATWNDQVASRRKGISGRFLSLSKRYFSGASNRTSAAASSNYDQLTGSYPPTTPEAQMRKLADFAFMLRDWKLAHSIYDLLRTDFNNDKAWKYHAAAQEMTVITHILSGNPISHKVRTDIIEPLLDLACYSYISRCAAHYSALRCLLVSIELLRLRGGGAVDEAAKWCVRAREIQTLGPIAHALVTERVGDCYAVRVGRGGNLGGRRRKAAMWKMLAAGEWAAAGKSVQTRRCLDYGLPMYEGTTWGAIAAFQENLKVKSGYAPLVAGLDGEEDMVEGEGDEKEEFGAGESKRRSVIQPAPAARELEELKGLDDGFAQS